MAGLLTNADKIRYSLQTRNLYTPNVEYPSTNNNITNKIVNSVSNVLDVVKPFDTFNLKNSIIGRIVDSTPLTEIGLVMLAKQMAYNSASHLAQENLPIIKVSNLFDGSKDTKLFTKKTDLKITKKENNTFKDKIGNFIDKIVFDASSSDENPFNNNATNEDIIRNTGSGQLEILIKNLNNNLYKSDNTTLLDAGNKIKSPISSRSSMVNTQSGGIVGNIYKPFFNFSNSIINPYLSFNPSYFSEIGANQAMAKSYLVDNNIQEYAPNLDYIKTYFGKTKLKDEFNLFGNVSNEWVDNNIEFKSESDVDNKLVWGRNGISRDANANIDKLRGDKDQVDNDYSIKFEDGFFGENFGDTSYNKFNIKSGLLEYTKNLINSTNGVIGDLTRKAFIDNDQNLGFNGSALWKANQSTYAQKSGYNGKTGVRQVNVYDQYDKYTKAIRFNGNQVYGGNENSVVYKSVLPRIHPTLPLNSNNVPDNKNLMFSIENLAVGVFSNGTYGIIDDENGSKIPICEVGAFGGRMMWFPPYGIELNETINAKNEATVMVGRNEPMYTYMNSERSASLSFILLMDYPDHLRDYHNTKDNQKNIAEFFAFGGDPYKYGDDDKPNEDIKRLEDEITEITNYPDGEDPQTISPETLKIVFPNDVPFENDNLNNIIDKLYKDYNYEIKRGLPSKGPYDDYLSFGFNNDIFITDETTGVKPDGDTGKYYLDVASLTPSFTQYDLDGDCKLNNKLKDFFSNEQYRKLYNVSIYGSASTLYIGSDNLGDTYNDDLGLRRANAAVNFVKKRLAALFKTDFNSLGIEVSYKGKGTIGRSQSTSANNTDAVKLENTKLERSAFILIERNSNKVEFSQKKELSEDEKNTIKIKQEQIDALKSEMSKRNKAYECMKNERTEKDGILHGFQSIMDNKFSPVFHSQTPEDFHKRLTFLQQCVRQGSAKKYGMKEENGQLRAKNSVFGRQPVCILRLGDFFYTKIVIDSITFDYSEASWDTNPEGWGCSPMLCKVSMQIKIIGGQSLKGPIDALQNAVSFNYYANSNFRNEGLYKLPSEVANKQEAYIKGILSSKESNMRNAYNEMINNKEK